MKKCLFKRLNKLIFVRRKNKMRKKTSLKDIAKRVGVSVALVSYVVNDKNLDRINKDTAASIRKAAKEMNYRPNRIAQSLKKNKTKTIGLLVADIANPYSSMIARIVEDEAEKFGYSVLFGSAYESVKKSAELIRIFLSRQVDGLIIAPPGGFEEELDKLKEEDIPFVLIDRYFPGKEYNSIRVDDYDSAYGAVKHLIDNGYKRVGIINYQTTMFHLNERTRGYKDALKDAGLKAHPDFVKIIEEKNLEVEVETAMKEMLNRKNPVDALFFTSSNVAIEGLSYLNSHQLSNSDEIGLVCFDETRFYGLYPKALTYVKQPLEEIGKTALRVLKNVMENSSKIEIHTLKNRLVIKESSLKTVEV